VGVFSIVQYYRLFNGLDGTEAPEAEHDQRDGGLDHRRDKERNGA
jgi:hypothetical protein